MKIKTSKTLIITLNCILAIIWLMPLYWSFVTSVKTEEEIYGGITLIPNFFTLENYIDLFQFRDGVFFSYLANSITLCLMTMVVVVAISVLAGFAFSKLKLFASKLWISLSLLTIMVPVQALMVPLHNTMASLNLLGTELCMILIYTTFQAPFCVVMMKNAFDMIPNTLREAALIDGARSFDVFRIIYLPLALPSVITVLIFSAYTTWNDYVVALTFGGSIMKTFNVGLIDVLGEDLEVKWGVLTSGSIIGILPIVVLFLVLQKYFIKGLMSGAIK